MSPLKILLLSYIEKYGGGKILYLKKEGLDSISDKLNPFWRDILLNFRTAANKRRRGKRYY